jgi:AGZA family xanthine/uracil permease-like MFS transporter
MPSSLSYMLIFSVCYIPRMMFLANLSIDTTGTLYSMAKFAGLRDPVTMDFENSTIAYCVDAFSISMGALMGTSPVTAFIESATGISGKHYVLNLLDTFETTTTPEGGKTGITAMVTGLCFLVSVFFAPIFASIPSWATGGALIIVGSLMIRKYVIFCHSWAF